MRIVLCGDGTRGDLQPLIELAACLSAARHDAVVCGPPDFAALAAARGVAYEPLGESAQAFFRDHASMLRRSPLAILREAFAYVERNVAAKLVALVEIARGADLVVAGGAELAASSAAERLGIPYRYVCYCPAVIPSDRHAPVFIDFDTPGRWRNRALWPLVIRPIEVAVRRMQGPARRAVGLGPVRRPYRHLLGERPLLAADAVLADVPPDAPVPVQQIPALHPLGGEPLPAKLAAFLDAGPPPVYVGFGSMPDDAPAATTRLVLAAIERLGVRAVLSSGWAQLGGLALPEGVVEVGPVAHPHLFPRCAAIVHHGGAGTTTTALRAGVPQVVVPHLADQFYWARRVRELGAGVTAPRKSRIDSASLVSALGAVLDNEALAARAADLGAAARAAAGAMDPVAALLAIFD
ncbi:MAG: glycosyl transferase [Proteobacteria bacterium]|nr:MAG: glycosyl transferase [Pseudomonadota bacterium]